MNAQATTPHVTRALRASRMRHGILFVICLLYLISYLDRVNISVTAPKIIQEFHFSKTEMGLVFSAFAYTYGLLQIVGGTLGDKYGPRSVLTLLMTWWSAFTILTGFAWNLASIFVIRLLFGLGEAGGFPVSTRALSAWYPPSARGMLQGVTHAFARLGAAIAPPAVVAIVLAFNDWRAPFYILGAIGFAWSLIFFLFFRNLPTEKSSVNELELREIYGSSGTPPPRTAEYVVPWSRILHSKDVWFLVLSDFCYGYSLWIYISWLPSYFVSARHFSFKQMGFFAAALPLLGGMLGDIVGGLFTDWFYTKTGNLNLARRGTIIVAFLGSIAFTVPAVLTKSPYVSVFAMTGAFFFLECSNACLWAVSMDLGGRRYSGTVSGCLNTGFGVAGFLSPVVFGMLVDWTGSWALPFVVSMALLVIGAILITQVNATASVDPEGAEAAAVRVT